MNSQPLSPVAVIWPVWLNGWVFVYELSGCGFESSCSHLNFRFRACFKQGVPWHSGNYRVWIHSEMRAWHDLLGFKYYTSFFTPNTTQHWSFIQQLRGEILHLFWFMESNEQNFYFLYFVWINHIFTWNCHLSPDLNYVHWITHLFYLWKAINLFYVLYISN